jgi:hypothetical protein
MNFSRRQHHRDFCSALVLLCLLAQSALGQSSGGQFQITNSVIAGGGGASCDGGANCTGSNTLLVEGTAGESAAGTLLRNPPYSAWSGFYPSTLTLTPTAAPGIISGQVTSGDGAPLAGVTIALSGQRNLRSITDASGFYTFDDLETGGFYSVTASLVNFTFSPSSRSFSLVASHADAIFTGTPSSVTANPLDTTEFFIRQHYLDFLGREPDLGGLNYWSAELDKCKVDDACVRQRRIGISAAFFVESEFQETGSFIYRLYKGALGRRVAFSEFSTDRQQVVAVDNLDQKKAAFADAFVRRQEFMQKYSNATSAESLVDTLIQTVRQSSGADLSNRRGALLVKYNSGANINEARSLAVREAIEDASFKQAEYNKAFVIMQYFGYLRRDPEPGGYLFWLNVLNNREPNNYRGMVCSFITSAEYHLRFGSLVTHSNQECSAAQ